MKSLLQDTKELYVRLHPYHIITNVCLGIINAVFAGHVTTCGFICIVTWRYGSKLASRGEIKLLAAAVVIVYSIHKKYLLLATGSPFVFSQMDF